VHVKNDRKLSELQLEKKNKEKETGEAESDDTKTVKGG